MLVCWFVMYFIAVLTSLTCNLVIHTNDYRLPFNFYLIFLPFEGFSFNWILNYVYQLGLGLIAAVFICANFPLTLLVIDQICLHVETATLNVEHLNRLLGSPKNDSSRRLAIKKRFIMIVEKTRQIEQWRVDVQDLIQFHFLILLTAASFVFCLAIFTISKNVFGCLTILFVLSTFMCQLFVNCWMGTRFMTSIEKLSVALYEIEWHLLEPKHQKDLQMIILMVQTRPPLDGVFKAVTLQTFKEVGDA